MEQERDGAEQEIRLWLEIRVEDGHEVIALDVAPFHAFSQCPGLVTIPVASYLVLNVDPFARPPSAFQLHQFLDTRVGRIVQHLNYDTVLRPQQPASCCYRQLINLRTGRTKLMNL